jgi:hypothetical protein
MNPTPDRVNDLRRIAYDIGSDVDEARIKRTLIALPECNDKVWSHVVKLAGAEQKFPTRVQFEKLITEARKRADSPTKALERVSGKPVRVAAVDDSYVKARFQLLNRISSHSLNPDEVAFILDALSESYPDYSKALKSEAEALRSAKTWEESARRLRISRD